MREQQPIERVSRWFRWVRLALVAAAILATGLESDFPQGYRPIAWVACVVLAAGAAALFLAGSRDLGPARRERFDLLALGFDLAATFAFVLIFSFEAGQPLRSLTFLVAIEGALRFGRRGAYAAAAVSTLLLLAAEWWRSAQFDFGFHADPVVLRGTLLFVIAALVGELTGALRDAGRGAEVRAGEAERLRDELGRRIDSIEAANRCARALASSLELEHAFAAFIRELGALMPFNRVAIVLVREECAEVVATAGESAGVVFPRGTMLPLEQSLLRDLLGHRPVYRADMADRAYPDEAELAAAGLRSRLAAPLLLGGSSIGMLSLSRDEPNAFSAEEIELLTLLGRLVAAAMQNIRAYERERETVGELRRLSELRADFVSLVSHELRSPMAAVIGSAQTLQKRWPDLEDDQRRALLVLIGEETTRLATLVDDVLDTSRIEAGTFGFSFSDVDVTGLVRESAAAAEAGGGGVRIRTSCADGLPRVRGDRERLRQVLANLIDNAVKYSPKGGEVRIATSSNAEHVRIDVVDHGHGIARDQQDVIFEKFGRAHSPGRAKPGTGLGLFIARSIAEAHGGSLEVRSAPDLGATFTLALPAE